MKVYCPRLLSCLAIGVGLFTVLATQTRAQQNADVIHACYVPKTGVIYRIDPSGELDGDLRAECSGGGKHFEFQWDQQPAAGMLGAVTFATATSQVRPPESFEELLTTSFTTAADGPAVISFYANAAKLDGPSEHTGLLYRLMIDGSEVVSGNRIRNDFESEFRDAQMYGFDWAVNLAAGSHTVAVEWVGLCDSDFPGCATMDSRSLIVRHGN